MRHLAKLFCLILSLVTGWKAYALMDGVFEQIWVPFGIAAAIVMLVFALLYFPLIRHLFDILEDRLSATNQQFRASRAGVGLDEIPVRRHGITQSINTGCAICGEPSNEPVCDRCQKKMAR